MSIQRWLNCPKRDARILSPGESLLVSAPSHAPVPEDGKMNTWPVSVLNTFLRSASTLLESSGNFEDRWSSIATIMARCTRSGTLVGPGTNRKFRPGIRFGIAIPSDFSGPTCTAAQFKQCLPITGHQKKDTDATRTQSELHPISCHRIRVDGRPGVDGQSPAEAIGSPGNR